MYAGPGSATCGGSITATFVWNDGGDGAEPPPALLLKETSVAEWYGDAGSCANGLGSPVVETEYPDNPGGTCEGVKWTIREAPGPQFTVTCSPAALMTLGSGSPYYGFCRVNYTAQVFGARLVLGGMVWKDGPTNKVAIGQKVTAQVVLDAGAPDPTSYAWTVSGGEPFADYVPTTNSAIYTAYQPGSTATTEFYFRVPHDRVPIECQVTFLGVPGKMTLEDRVDSVAPTFHDRSGSLGTPKTLKEGSPRTPSTLVSEVAWLGPHEAVRTGFPGGFGILLGGALDDTVCREPLPPGQSGPIGQWTFVQQVNNDALFHLVNGQTDAEVFADWPLDYSYPYPGIYSDPPTKNPVQWVGAEYSSQTGQRTGVLVDSPVAPVYRQNPPVAVADMTVTMEFRTTILYIAPGYAKPVPIRRWDWQWSATAVRGSTNWTVSNATSSLSSPISAPLHPVWTYKVG
ncbi:MAG: hypothetical protein KIS66_07805 [Fimbriimonadaceae bacterium]|nr:hypothetical protein [Fimbriimonadaceae bacterium]